MLFAQSLVNLVVPLQSSYNSDIGTINIAVSLSALFSGLFIVGAGDFADKFGRVNSHILFGLKYHWFSSYYHHAFTKSINHWSRRSRFVSSLYYAGNPAIINEYYIGTARQRALSYWSIGSWGGSGVCTLFGGMMATNLGWRSIFIVSIVLTILAMF